jgi:hypothetical protein
MEDDSRRVLPVDLQKASARITLEANGSFVASEMPGLFYFPGIHAVQLDFQMIAGWKERSSLRNPSLHLRRKIVLLSRRPGWGTKGLVSEKLIWRV